MITKNLRQAGLALGLALQIPISAVQVRAEDSRIKAPLRTLESYFPFQKVASNEEWSKRAEKLRIQTLVSNGLWPLPKKTPLEAVVHGKVERDDYTVEKVYFQSWPGHYVTGSIYRPKGKSDAKRAAILTPHGHWADGRFHDHGEQGVAGELKSGAEKFERSGRHPLQARCVQLARMGCVVFHYDMIGYADSVQLAHRPGVREHMNTKKDWGFFSPQAELRLQNMMGLQTWNSIRAVDFVLSLPDVDPKRIGVTGGSGGGTQSFMLAAVDERIAVAAPAVMVSTAMQGGCTCENAPYLRVNAGNIDLAGIIAPRPLKLIAANDWTKELETKGAPDLQKLFEMLGVPGNFSVSAFLQFGHNYNAASRGAVYSWFNKHLRLGVDEPIVERDFEPLSRKEASVWDDAHPAPKIRGDDHERALLALMTADSETQIATLRDKAASRDREAVRELNRILGGAWDAIIGRTDADIGEVTYDLVDKAEQDGFLSMTGLLSIDAPSGREEVTARFLYPGDDWNHRVVLWLDMKGASAALLTKDGKPKDEARKLLDKGYVVMSIDFLTAQGEGEGKQRIQAMYGGKSAWNHYAAYTFGYNHPLFVQRVHDAMTAIAFLNRNPKWDCQGIVLIGEGAAGAIANAAAMQTREVRIQTDVSYQDFRFASLTSFDDPNFVPGAVKYGDVFGLVRASRQAAAKASGKLDGEFARHAVARILARKDAWWNRLKKGK